jgi:large subunit ribosomal protein L35
MPKMKTKRSAAKRLRKSGSGKLMRASGWKQHKLEGKEPKRRRRLRKTLPISKADAPRLKKLVPYL